MTATKNKRRAFPVTSSVQYTFLALVLAYGFIVVCFVASAIFVPDILEMQDESLAPAVRSSAASRILAKNAWALPASLSLVIFLALHSFRAFQRVMGPLHRFRCAFEEFARGNLLYPVKIRKKDYLHVEEKAIEEMIAAFSEQIKTIRRATESALQSFQEVENAWGSSHPSAEISRGSLAAHRERLENLERAVCFFQMEDESAVTNRSGDGS